MSLPSGYFNEILQDQKVLMSPLSDEDFENLYSVASDPLIWEQHPNKNRYLRPEFQNYFKGAIESKGAYLIIDKTNGAIAGSTRFYDYNEFENSVFIGYTFIARKYWGKGINQSIKKMMLEHAFAFCENVHFHVGKHNLRSQIAMERLGGKKMKEIEVAYFGEPSRVNFEYTIEKQNFHSSFID